MLLVLTSVIGRQFHLLARYHTMCANTRLNRQNVINREEFVLFFLKHSWTTWLTNIPIKRIVFVIDLISIYTYMLCTYYNHISIHIESYTLAYVYMHTHTHTHIAYITYITYAYTYVHSYMDIHICIHTLLHVYTYICLQWYTYKFYKHTSIHIHTYICITYIFHISPYI